MSGRRFRGQQLGDAAWRIKKILTVGAETTILYADGNTAFDNVWNNRTGLSYA
jgi:hypothetical protein